MNHNFEHSYLSAPPCPMVRKPSTEAIANLTDPTFREWLKSLDMTGLVDTRFGSHKDHNVRAELLQVRTLKAVPGQWYITHASRVISQHNETPTKLEPGDDVRIALQNFRVQNISYEHTSAMGTSNWPSQRIFFASEICCLFDCQVPRMFFVFQRRQHIWVYPRHIWVYPRTRSGRTESIFCSVAIE